MLSGIIPPIVTPLDPYGAVDVNSVRSLVDFHIDAGVDGLFALGTSGEAALLSRSRRVSMVEATVSAAAGRVPVLAGIIESSVDRVLDEAAAVANVGADYLVATTPFYASPSETEVLRHFEKIAASVNLPVLAYDIPSKTHSKLPEAVVLSLAQSGTVVGLKDSSGDFSGFRSIATELAGTPFALLTGSELLVDAAMFVGASGSVPGLANIDPRGFVEVASHARAHRWAEARTAQERLVRIYRGIFFGVKRGLSADASIIGALKASLQLMGVIESGRTAWPMEALPQDVLEDLKRLLVQQNVPRID